jgi:glucose/arabinose dehydrogenase
MRQQLIGMVAAGLMAWPAASAAQEAAAKEPVAPGLATNSVGFALQMIEGQPIEPRPPEKADDKPAFPGQTRAPYHVSVPYKASTIAEKLDHPRSFALLPDDRIIITEKGLTARILGKQGSLSRPITGFPALLGPSGLLDVAVDPRFAANRRVFFVIIEGRPDGDSAVIVVRARLDPAAAALSDASVIFRSTAAKPKTQVGRIAIARDGNLFVIIGDRSNSPPWNVAQQMDTHLGKIVRITPDGKPAPGNPFIGKAGVLPEIWASGGRSQEGLAFDPQGRLWETEHGPRGGDELNLIRAGANYGWPVIVHGIDYPGGPIGEGLTEKAGMEQPRYYWDPVIGPSGLAFYTGELFPQWKGSAFVGALRGMMLDRLTIEGDKVVAEEPLLVDLQSRTRDVRVGPDGAVYVLTDKGVLYRLVPA